MKPREETIEHDGLRLHFREWGDNRTRHAIVMLHGYVEASEAWDECAADLAREYRVIAFDLRGYGRSARADDLDYSRSAQVEDIEALIAELGLRSVTLVGHSMGGAAAMCYAAEHPEEVTALVVIETAPEVLRSGVESIRRLLASAERFDSIEEAMDAFRAFYPYAANDQLERRVHASLAPDGRGGYTWNFDPALRDPMVRPPEPDPGQRRLADLWDCADRVQCPTMIVRGAETDMLTPEAIQRLHRRIVGSRVSLVEDAGHPLHTDQPAALALNIREFLQSISTRG